MHKTHEEESKDAAAKPAAPKPSKDAATVAYRSGGVDIQLVPQNAKETGEGATRVKTADLYDPVEVGEDGNAVLKVKGALGAAEPTEGCYLDPGLAKEKADADAKAAAEKEKAEEKK